MNRTVLALCLAALALAFLAHRVGYSRGLEASPEYARLERDLAAESAARIDAWMVDFNAEPDVCDQIFDLVEDELNERILLDQAARSEIPDDR